MIFMTDSDIYLCELVLTGCSVPVDWNAAQEQCLNKFW